MKWTKDDYNFVMKNFKNQDNEHFGWDYGTSSHKIPYKKCDGWLQYDRYGRGLCLATKECDPCDCHGLESKCDFYEDVRNKATQNRKETEQMTSNMFNGMFGKVSNGMCRLTMSGEIAVKTGNGYKNYNVKTGHLTNCDSFVFNIGEEFFFVIPTNKVERGDIILVANKPKCVIASEKNMITVINYEDSTVENIIPERHVFMGNTYFYGKIVSMFGNNMLKGKKGMDKMMSYMMMTEMMKGTNGNSSNMGNMLPMMMLMNGGNMSDMFSGMFDFDMDEEDEDNESEAK